MPGKNTPLWESNGVSEESDESADSLIGRIEAFINRVREGSPGMPDNSMRGREDESETQRG